MKNIAKKISAVFVSMAVTFQIFAGDMFGTLTAFAAVETVGPYIITGGARNIDYTLEGNILKVLTNIPLRIENVDKTTASTVPIEIVKDVSANIMLTGVNIASTGNAALFIDDNSKGNVTITIADDTTNTLKGAANFAGLQKNGNYISENEGKLTIQGGTVGNGVLNATGGSHSAGIGSNATIRSTSTRACNIIIKGGTINAIGGSYAAGIGSGGITYSEGRYGSGRSYADYIIIYDGIITAQGGNGAAGIGSGYVTQTYADSSATSYAKHITISGGTITAKGGSDGPGIGSGWTHSSAGGDTFAMSYTSDVTITGGNITAIGNSCGAGIGSSNASVTYSTGSDSNTVSNILISGGVIKAVGGDSGAPGIGASVAKLTNDSELSNVTILEAIVTASGGKGGAGIGSCGSCSGITIANNSIVTATGGINGGSGIGGVTCTNVIIENSSVKATGGAYGSYYGAKIGGYATSSKDGTPICPVNENGDNLYLAVFENPNGNPIYIDGEEYPITQHADDDKNVYVYMTDEWHTVTIDDVTKGYNVRVGVMLDLPEVTPPVAAENLVYDTTAQTLLSEAATTSNGTIKYSLEKKGVYSAEFPKATNAGTYKVWYYSEGDSFTYANTIPEYIEVTIAKAKLNIGSEYTDTITTTEITYGDSLADSVLDGTGPVAGHYEWKDDSIKPSVADSETMEFAVLFVPDDTNYISDDIGVTLKVNKKTFVFSAENKAAIIVGDIEYGQTLGDSVITGYTPIDGSYEFKDKDYVPSRTEANNYTLKFIPDDTDNYEVVEIDGMHINVVKATPKFTAEQLASIKGSAITYGQTLADSTISGDKPVEGLFEWKDNTVAPAVSDSERTEYAIWFKPTDTDNYNDKTLACTLKVNKAVPTVPSDLASKISATGLTYEQTLNDSTLSYLGAEPFTGTLSWRTPTAVPAVADSDTIAYDVVYTPVDSDNYLTLDYTATVHVDKKAFVFTQENRDAIIISSIEFGQKLGDATFSGYKPIDGHYEWDNEDYEPIVKAANNYLLKFIPDDTDNYEIVELVDMHITVTPPKPKFTAEQLASIKASEITYGDSLADSTITGDKPMAGSFSWKDDSIQPSVLDSESTDYEIVFTPDDSDNYSAKTLTVKLKVNKATPTVPSDIASKIVATAIKFGQTLGNSALSYTGDEAFSGEILWDTPTVKPAMSDSDTISYGVTYKPVDHVNYKTLSYVVTIHVDKGEAPAQLKDKVSTIPVKLGGNESISISDLVNLPGVEVKDIICIDESSLLDGTPQIEDGKLIANVKNDATLKDKTADIVLTIGSRDYEDFQITVRVSATKCDHIKKTSGVGQKAATCESEGYSGDTVCDNCHAVIKTGTVIPTRSHVRRTINVVSATCKSEGFSGDVYCRDCGVFLENGHNTSRTEHIEGTPVVLVEPTELTLGVREYRCVICNQITRRESIEYVKPDDDSNSSNETNGSNGANNNANPVDREEMESNGWNYDASILNYLIVSEAGSGIVDSEGNAVDEHGEHHYDYYREIEGQPGMYELYCSDCGEIHQAKLNVISSGAGKNPDTGISDKMAFISIALVAGCGIFISSRKNNTFDI